jgi:hypothetical protein
VLTPVFDKALVERKIKEGVAVQTAELQKLYAEKLEQELQKRDQEYQAKTSAISAKIENEASVSVETYKNQVEQAIEALEAEGYRLSPPRPASDTPERQCVTSPVLLRESTSPNATLKTRTTF